MSTRELPDMEAGQKATESSVNLISLKNVAVCYKYRSGFLKKSRVHWALRDISMEVRKGETLGIIGRNGAGKSTLLKILAGILSPDKGRIVRDGSRTTLLSLQVGFVPGLSGRQNAVLSGLLLGCSRQEIESKLPEIVQFSELEEFVDKPVKTYSSGMRARLGFSTAFYVDPEVILLDETLSVGDVSFSTKSSKAIRERMRSNRTVVLVSHQGSKVKELCDRVIWIDQGLTREEGRPEQVVKSYLDSFPKPQP